MFKDGELQNVRLLNCSNLSNTSAPWLYRVSLLLAHYIIFQIIFSLNWSTCARIIVVLILQYSFKNSKREKFIMIVKMQAFTSTNSVQVHTSMQYNLAETQVKWTCADHCMHSWTHISTYGACLWKNIHHYCTHICSTL